MTVTRNTIQCQIILNTVLKMQSHPTAENVYQEIQKEHPNISKSIVYRILHKLIEDDKIHSVLIPDSPE